MDMQVVVLSSRESSIPFSMRLAFPENLCSNKPPGSIIIAHNYRGDVDNIDTVYLPVNSTG